MLWNTKILPMIFHLQDDFYHVPELLPPTKKHRFILHSGQTYSKDSCMTDLRSPWCRSSFTYLGHLKLSNLALLTEGWIFTSSRLSSDSKKKELTFNVHCYLPTVVKSISFLKVISSDFHTCRVRIITPIQKLRKSSRGSDSASNLSKVSWLINGRDTVFFCVGVDPNQTPHQHPPPEWWCCFLISFFVWQSINIT